MSYYGDRRAESSIVEAFTLSPLPYPVILVLLMVTLLLGASWFFTYDDFIEEASQQLSWALLGVPIALVPPHPLDLLRRLLRGLPGLLPEGEPLEGPLRAGPRRGQLALGRRLARPPPPRARQLPLHHPRHVGAVNGRMWVLLLFDSTRARMRLYCWLLLDRSMDR
uniref:Uncharacterized protein n=1 Tax=Zea mays TaxID=4577 RepID=A0A804RL16_MAIZE